MTCQRLVNDHGKKSRVTAEGSTMTADPVVKELWQLWRLSQSVWQQKQHRLLLLSSLLISMTVMSCMASSVRDLLALHLILASPANDSHAVFPLCGLSCMCPSRIRQPASVSMFSGSVSLLSAYYGQARTCCFIGCTQWLACYFIVHQLIGCLINCNTACAQGSIAFQRFCPM